MVGRLMSMAKSKDVRYFMQIYERGHVDEAVVVRCFYNTVTARISLEISRFLCKLLTRGIRALQVVDMQTVW